ncbi:MAG: DNA polymerase I, partial [Myxococcota bacterium]|nr:DNA polymerase I [Myxococcota bacterium]
VKGIGEKGAAKLIKEWGTLEELLDHAEEIKGKKAREGLISQRKEAELSKELSTLRQDVDLSTDWDALEWPGQDVAMLRSFYERMGFTRLIASLEEVAQGEAGASEVESIDQPIEVEVLTDLKLLTERLEALKKKSDPVALYLLSGEGSAVDSEGVGLGVALSDHSAVYVPISGRGMEAARPGVPPDDLVKALGRFWGETKKTNLDWFSSETKKIQETLSGLGLRLPVPCDDLAIAGFLLDPAGSQELSMLASTFLGRRVESWEDVAGRGAKALAAEALPVERAAAWVSERVTAAHALAPRIRERLETDGLMELYRDLELPLTDVLARMEEAGVRVDEERLAALGVEYKGKLEAIETEIYSLAGEKFLISSPKQLQVILFEKLGLPAIKKTKTGYSTSESVLEQLRDQHDLPGLILDYRKLAKLMSTYIDALPRLVSEETGRIHPRFHQLGAATGRLSASNPNVQNIPIRGDEGARIREAFVPREGRVMLSADYSQVELRILAHYAQDETLIKAFKEGDDIHRLTAAEVWGVRPEDVSPEERARAKAVNFGIIYGSSAFGLANQLGIATAEAQETIDAYFDRYKGVRDFIDGTISSSKERGYTSTFLGRRRYLPDLRSRNRTLRQAAERVAVNSVIQGTAADLIKKAMILISASMKKRSLPETMILQVHDELVFEVEKASLESLGQLVVKEMEGALAFRVPLVVDLGHGENWREAH